jgi:hypothetical protein
MHKDEKNNPESISTADLVRELIDPDKRDGYVDAVVLLYNQSEEGMLPAGFDTTVREGLNKICDRVNEDPQVNLEDEFDSLVDELTGVAGRNSYHNITPPSNVMKQAILEMVARSKDADSQNE